MRLVYIDDLTLEAVIIKDDAYIPLHVLEDFILKLKKDSRVMGVTIATYEDRYDDLEGGYVYGVRKQTREEKNIQYKRKLEQKRIKAEKEKEIAKRQIESLKKKYNL